MDVLSVFKHESLSCHVSFSTYRQKTGMTMHLYMYLFDRFAMSLLLDVLKKIEYVFIK